MEQAPPGLTIGSFAAAAGVNVETVRYYQRKGLLSEPARPRGSIRRYGDEDVARVKFIKSAQRLGFSLDEVASLLTLDDGMHCGQARQLAQSKLASVQARLADLRRIESVLKGLIRQCAGARGQVACPIVQALHGSRIEAAAPL